METRFPFLKHNKCAHEFEVRTDILLYLFDYLLRGSICPLLGLSCVVGLFLELLVNKGVYLVFYSLLDLCKRRFELLKLIVGVLVS